MKVDQAEVNRRMEEFQAAARDAGLKLTHQRLEIFREVAASLEHPTADQVHRVLRERLPTVSLDTVYRTLWLLNDMGLLATLGPPREGMRFDGDPRPHHHFVCVRCGQVRDFKFGGLRGLPEPGDHPGLGRVVSAHLEVRGFCERCSAGAPPT